MGQIERSEEDRKARSKAKGKNDAQGANGGLWGGGATNRPVGRVFGLALWDGYGLTNCVAALLACDALVSFGLTRDGGTLRLTVLKGAGRETVYMRGDDVAAAAEELNKIEAWAKGHADFRPDVYQAFIE